MNKKIEQITINACCGTTSIWLENEFNNNNNNKIFIYPDKKNRSANQRIGWYKPVISINIIENSQLVTKIKFTNINKF